MIGKLKGIVDRILEDKIILDVNGVGYLVACSTNTISKLGGIGSEASLEIETFVREDQISLFGFADQHEKAWFNLLTGKVNGVGAKMGIVILSTLSPQEISIAIASKDKAAFKRCSGVGPKLAERIVLELQDSAKKMDGLNNVVMLDGNNSSGSSVNVDMKNNDISDAAMALEKLGFGRSEAFSVVTKLYAEDENIQLEGLIKEGLKQLTNFK